MGQHKDGSSQDVKTETPDAMVSSGIQVLDRAVYILSVIAAEPRTLTQLCEITGLPRATTHRIAVALEKHRLIERLPDAQWTTGPALSELAPQGNTRLLEAADHVLPRLVEEVGESVQLYRLSGGERVCIAAAEKASGLRDTVPVGARMTLAAGSAAKVLVAHSAPDVRVRMAHTGAYDLEELDRVVSTGIAESIGERDESLASASVPIRDQHGVVIAALSVSGPVNRMGPSPAERFGPALRFSARILEQDLEPRIPLS